MTLQPQNNNNDNRRNYNKDDDGNNDINNVNVVGSYELRQRRRRYATKGWLLMMFMAYSFLLIIRLHFTYSMMVMMTVPLVPVLADRPLCPGAELNVGANSTIVVSRRLDWTIQQQAVTMGSYFFGTLVSTLPGGVYSSRSYERSIMLWCVAITATTVALMPVAFAHNESWMAVTFLRFLQGCAFGPTGSCGGTLAGKIVRSENKIMYSTLMFSGTMFGGFLGHLYSALAIRYVSHGGSYLMLSVAGLVWVVVWATMMHQTPYISDSSDVTMSVSFISSGWTEIMKSMPFVSLLNASFGLGFLYSFITTGLPIYTANVLGGDAVKAGLSLSVSWLLGWISSLTGISAASFSSVGTGSKTMVRKFFVGMVLIGSPLMLFGTMVSGCNEYFATMFMRFTVILLGFERSSIRINSMDLCPGYVGSLIAMCDMFYSMGNIIDLVAVRSLFAHTMNWTVTFLVTIIVSIACSILFLLFGSSKQQCWDQRYVRP